MPVIKNKGQVNAVIADKPVAVESNTTTLTVVEGQITNVKSQSKDAAWCGDTVDYTFTLTNNTNMPATNGQWGDMLPDGLCYVPGSFKVDGAPAEPMIFEDPYIHYNLPQPWAPGVVHTISFRTEVCCKSEGD